MKKYINPIIASSVSLLMLSACVSTTGGANPNAQQNSTNHTATGAIVGGLLGAIVGGATSGKHHRGKRTAVAAVAGAAVGAAVGYSLDQQAKEVAQVLNTNVNNNPSAEQDVNQDLIVSNTDKYVKIMFRDDMMFATNSAIPTPSAQRKINQLTPVLKKYPNTLIQTVGHTDNRGSFQHNQTLSENRASSVGNSIQSSGIPNIIYSKGCSFSKPIAPNTNAVNWGLNRRVEVYLYPNEAVAIDPCRN
jgi:outer membrane protein OmpA-like peptidoglycan-associated protein